MRTDSSSTGVRLQKVLAQAGVASRRRSEELIVQGRVQVNGVVARELGSRVDPDQAVIHVDGLRITTRRDRVYLALNKPRGVHSTMVGERGEPCVGDYVREYASDEHGGIFHVGRLDADTEGLLLLTNDGDLAHRLMHPSYEVSKTYVAEVEGRVAQGLGKQLRAGVELADGMAAVDRFRIRDQRPKRTLVEIVLHEGRKHLVRRLFEQVGHPVRQLVRTAVDDVRLGTLKPGELRTLTMEEVGLLHRAVGL